MSELDPKVIEQTSNMADGVSQLAAGFKRKAEAMDRIKAILADPDKYTVYDLLNASIAGGYQLKLNFHEIGAEG